MALEDYFYRREVLGKDKTKITIFKIKSMHPEIQSKDSLSINKLDQLGKPDNSHRITRFGKIIRKYGIDELPQITNIILGEMSLVGIRPRNEAEWESFPKDHFENAMLYKPGFFGIQYCDKTPLNINEFIQREKSYLLEKNQNPIFTDAKYLSKWFYYTLFKGVRSK